MTHPQRVPHAHRARRAVGRLSAVLAIGAALLWGTTAPALAEDTDDTGTGAGTGGPSTVAAGTSFRTAGVLEQGGVATSSATIGEYLYWVFPVAAGQNANASATVTFRDQGTRSGPTTWRLDLYDGLRRLQPCTAGRAEDTAEATADTLVLDCTLRTVRAWAEPWANDPLPGAYYLRLTAVDLPEEDLGLPVEVTLEVGAEDAGGARARGGELPAPLLLTNRAGEIDPTAPADGEDAEASEGEEDAEPAGGASALAEPEVGWNGGWWSDRWLWTGAGGVLGGLAAVAGYTLVRRPRV
ncbi:hypothetical protein GCM10027160_48820 [Streptomyces calidiresistens]|uniref:Peptidase n=1 Tax=Streptomyces calidiresistens TaxID=1485586 RepID=A0A7W3T173_9ACTN|nr:hypothetical protein [Streptomyces calidiresistens]MBB0229024.1 hypothetical protein [Streptomyces calidiresistens]